MTGYELTGLIFNGLITLAVTVVEYYMRRLEKNTNSIKDELVAATLALGIKTGRAQVHDEQK